MGIGETLQPLFEHSSDVWVQTQRLRRIVFRSMALTARREFLLLRLRITAARLVNAVPIAPMMNRDVADVSTKPCPAFRRPGTQTHWRTRMTAFVAASRHTLAADLEPLTPLLIFCCAGLLVSLLAISCGVDLGSC